MLLHDVDSVDSVSIVDGSAAGNVVWLWVTLVVVLDGLDFVR